MATGKQKWIETQQEIKKKVKNGDSEGFSNTLPHLSHDIIINDILTRVPVDSLMRFRCVCKLWSNLIVNDLKFVSLHLSRTYSDRGFIWLFYSDNYLDRDNDTYFMRCNGVVFYDIDRKEKKIFHFRPETGLVNKRLFIRDSLNGLLLLSCVEDGLVTNHVYNPITGYSVKLPILQDIACLRNSYEFLPQLAYDSIMKKYKVFCIYYDTGRIQNGQYFFKILTLGTESEPWRDVVVSELYPRLRHDDLQPRFASGSFYWLNHDRFESYSSDDHRKILAFDVSRETFYTIKYPKGALNDSNLLEIDGSVCFLDYVSAGKLKLWVLKEDKEKKNNQHQQCEWVEKYNVDETSSLSGLEPPSSIFGYQPVPSACYYAIVTTPTVKIIFRTFRIPDEAHREGLKEFCSYDIQLRRSDSIFKIRGTPYQWHLNCLANF
ncbi:putative F-box protein At2g02030 [Papaver somniferum]|uniref:putative F-box protein At2g02030 n=1 Tax=Papaver somniferum TaxID=3469 RepID=UPI000E6F97F1|nr:putative F-box protein At2g02030 [Papaver somniferum]